MTQTFIVANAIGTRLPLAGINEKTITEAKRFFRAGTDSIRLVVDRDVPGNAFWFLATDEAAALELLADKNIGPVTPARNIKNSAARNREATQASRNSYDLAKAGPSARRVRHPKFGEGTVTEDGCNAVTVLFDKQKKPLRLVASAVETI